MDSKNRKGRALRWTIPNRCLVFVLAASSIWCLLAEMYGLCRMREFILFVTIPATTLLAIITVLDYFRGDRTLFRAVITGAIGGLIASAAYDIFRLPFVFSDQLGIENIVPHIPLYKVFPRFGAMILGQPIEQPAYSIAAQIVGWAFHLSDGVTFGIMYSAAIGDASRRHWAWAVLMAAGLELAMLYTPYPQFFAIRVGALFVAVTLAAHLIFGVVLGLFSRWHASHFSLERQCAKL